MDPPILLLLSVLIPYKPKNINKLQLIRNRPIIKHADVELTNHKACTCRFVASQRRTNTQRDVPELVQVVRADQEGQGVLQDRPHFYPKRKYNVYLEVSLKKSISYVVDFKLLFRVHSSKIYSGGLIFGLNGLSVSKYVGLIHRWIAYMGGGGGGAYNWRLTTNRHAVSEM